MIGVTLKKLIKSQFEIYKKEPDRMKKAKISQNLAYLIQVMSTLIKDEKLIEERIRKLELLSKIE